VYRAVHNTTGALAANRYTDSLATGGRQFHAPYGLGAQLSGAALTYSQYLGRYGATREDMAAFIVNNRKNASLNPDAVFYGKAITAEDYLNSRVISWPMAVLDCDMPVDGVCALIVTTSERARDLRRDPAYIHGYTTLGFDYGGWGPGSWETNMEAVRLVARAFWRDTGMSPNDVDVASFYDGFSYLTYIWLEGFSFCGEGEAFQFIQEGRIAVDGELPLNTSGGSLGMGRLHGAPQLIEAVRQIQGACGPRQVKEVHVAMANAGAPTAGTGVVMFTSEPVT
jgi:acetyl-CoA acetyltransferase